MQEIITIGLQPTFKSVRMGKWLLRLATAADITAGDARTVGDRILEHDDDGVTRVNEAST
jgi:hypothetical protein